jgi:hypothetical protein
MTTLRRHAVLKEKGTIKDFLELTGIKPVGEGITKKGSMITFFGRITPTAAAEILESFNDHNRVRRDGTALEYAQSIFDKDWEDTGIPILFDENGQTVDGQHRLAGCVIAKKPIISLIVFGVDFSAYRAIDRGKKRKLSDDLHTDGHAWAPDRAKLISLLYREQTGNQVAKLNGHPLNPSQGDAMDIDSEDGLGPQIDQALHFVYGYGRTWHPRKMIDRPLAAYLFIKLNAIHQPAACQYLHQLITGTIPEGAAPDNPVTSVRNRLLEVDTKDKFKTARKLLILLAGWNRFCAHGNRKLGTLVVSKLHKRNGVDLKLTEIPAFKKPNRKVQQATTEWFNDKFSLDSTLTSGSNAATKFLERSNARSKDVATQADRLRPKLEQ